MFSFPPRRIVAFLFSTLIVAPMFFFAPAVLRFNSNIAVAQSSVLNENLAGLSCGIIFGTIRDCIVEAGYLLLVKVPAQLLILAGGLFDTLIAFSLSSKIIEQQNFVDVGWAIMRDISNTFFIFILLYIAIATILQTIGGQTKKLLVTLILVALFMNFSLYFTKFVIDVSNVFALEFYVNMGVAKPMFIDISTNDVVPLSLSQGIIDAISPITLLNKVGINHDLSVLMFLFFMIGVLFIILCFVMLTVGFLMLARVVAFWLLMILSPLAFFSMVLPYTRGKIWSLWFSQLINQSFFAPIFFFFLYLSIMLATTLTNTPDAFFKQGLKSDPFLITILLVFLKFFAIITIILFGLKIAKSGADELGASMLKLGGAITGGAAGGAAYVGRNTIGRAAKYAEEKYGDRMDKSKSMRALKAVTLAPAANSSFDVRASKMAQTAQQTVGGINLGAAGGAGGFSKVAKDNERQNRDTYNRLKNNPEAQAAFVASLRRPLSSLDKEGTAKGFNNPDVHTKKLMQSLSSGQRTALIAKAKNPEDRLYLSKINESLGESFRSDADLQTLKEKAKKIRKEIKDGTRNEEEAEKEIEEIEDQIADLGSNKSGGKGGGGENNAGTPNPKNAARGKFKGTSGSSGRNKGTILPPRGEGTSGERAEIEYNRVRNIKKGTIDGEGEITNG